MQAELKKAPEGAFKTLCPCVITTPSKSCLLSSNISAMLFMVQSSDMNAWFCGDYHDFIISIRVVPFLLITAQCFQRNSCSLRLRSMRSSLLRSPTLNVVSAAE